MLHISDFVNSDDFSRMPDYLDIGVIASGNSTTLITLAAWRFLAFTIQRLGKIDCQCHLASMLRPNEEIGMSEMPTLNTSF
jgi:hypothetical protein